jgi:hypothetical protein
VGDVFPSAAEGVIGRQEPFSAAVPEQVGEFVQAAHHGLLFLLSIGGIADYFTEVAAGRE